MDRSAQSVRIKDEMNTVDKNTIYRIKRTSLLYYIHILQSRQKQNLIKLLLDHMNL